MKILHRSYNCYKRNYTRWGLIRDAADKTCLAHVLGIQVTANRKASRVVFVKAYENRIVWHV